MAIEITPAAAEELRRIMQDQGLTGPEVCLRVGLTQRGINHGFTLDLAERPAPNEHCFESQGLRIACKTVDLPRLDEYCIDFRTVSEARGFTFTPPPELPTSTCRDGDLDGLPAPEESGVRAALREVIDPEVGINIVDLGLIYGLDIQGRNIHVTMTMTTPACPLSEQIKNDVNARIMDRCPGVKEVQVKVVWEPPWHSDLITKDAKQTLGWFL